MFFKTRFNNCIPSLDNQVPASTMKPNQVPAIPPAVTKACLMQVLAPIQATNSVPGLNTFPVNETKETPPDQLAVQLTSVAIEGLTDEELSDSGGEGMYRERDEFVVRNEDIEILKVQSARRSSVFNGKTSMDYIYLNAK